MIRIQQKVMRWLGNSLDTVKDFSDEAKREAGHQLGRVQEGHEPSDWKSMESVGAGVRETSKADLDLASTRYRQLMNERNKK